MTPLSKHKKVGKDVLPPFAQLKREIPLQETDWTRDRLPEMLWAALLIAALGRDEGLHRFRRLGGFIGDQCQADEDRRSTLRDVTLSGLARWRDDELAT